MSQPVTFSQVLRNRQFLLLWLAQLISSFGDWLAILAIMSLVTFRWNGNSDQVAWLFIAIIGPLAIVGPAAGVYVDRWNLKRTMIASDLMRAVLAFALAFADQYWQIYLLMGAISVFSAFFLPAQGALLPEIVKKEELLVANALNGQTIHLTKIIGPAAAGFIVTSLGERMCFFLDSATFVISAGLLFAIHAARPVKLAAKGLASAWADLSEGVRFIWAHAALRFVLLASGAAIFTLGAFNALVAIFVRDVLRADPKLFGALVSVIGLGTILGAVAIGKFAQNMSRVILVTLAIAGVGVGVALFALSKSSIIAVGMSFFMGFAAAGVFITVQSFTQEEAPREMLGRVTSAAISICTLAQMVGIAIAGRLAERFGIRNLYYGIAVTLLLIAALGYSYARRERIGESRHAAAPLPAHESSTESV